MRGTFGLLKNVNGIGASTGIGIGNTTRVVCCSPFSTSSGGGRGRGGGGGSGPPRFDFVASHPGKVDDSSEQQSDDVDNSAPLSGVGRGRGTPLPSTASFMRPSFTGFVAQDPSQQPGVGRGGGRPIQQPVAGSEEGLGPKKPIFLVKDEGTGGVSVADSVSGVPRRPIGEKSLPESVLNVLTGSGRGKPERRPVQAEVEVKEENRHLRPRQVPVSGGDGSERGRERVESAESSSAKKGPKLSRDEAVKKAVGILSRHEDGEQQGEVMGGGRGAGRGAERGRGRGRGRGFSGRGRGRRRRDDFVEEEDDDETGLYLGDDADGEKFAEILGPELSNELTEAFEEMSYSVLPDPVEDEYIEALDTNLKIELEPEYLWGNLEANPDIDEKPPMPLPEALEKMKPFLMAYEGIENQEEWEEVVKEAMEKVPLLKEIVDHYCGPDRVTAKQQHEELERVAKTLPASAPDSVKRFTNRAVLSLQSNPGWGFDRKCQFMDKLVDEVSKSYK